MDQVSSVTEPKMKLMPLSKTVPVSVPRASIDSGLAAPGQLLQHVASAALADVKAKYSKEMGKVLLPVNSKEKLSLQTVHTLHTVSGGAQMLTPNIGKTVPCPCSFPGRRSLL